uniref:Suppressor APC domain-containing protein n=1 Tax=Rhinopithecus roxellana TaxID=61622 RepID=A0A2K6R1D9_RHIRO
VARAGTAQRSCMPPAALAGSTEGMPRAFLRSLSTLFDILDDQRRGCWHLREIQSCWQGADALELPRGVVPDSGYLTFERFTAGLHTALLSADGGPRDPTHAPVRPGDQPPQPPQRLMFAPADEQRTVLERKPLPLGVRASLAGPSGAARSPEQLCAPAEATPCPAEPERAALKRSPSADAGASACRTLEADSGDAQRAPSAGGERRRHTITSGQLQRVQERQCRLGQSRARADFGAMGSPSPLGRLLSKVQEVAGCLGDLLAAACASPALPTSSSGPPLLCWQQQTILTLKDQNRLLTQEVTEKRERIMQVEQKSALIKQLFESRTVSQQDGGASGPHHIAWHSALRGERSIAPNLSNWRPPADPGSPGMVSFLQPLLSRLPRPAPGWSPHRALDWVLASGADMG